MSFWLSNQEGMFVLVGFSGASGSGKTTLVNSLYSTLVEEGFDAGVVREVVREVFENWRKRYGYASLSEIRSDGRYVEFQKDVLVRQFEEEVDALNSHEIVLTDRTIYDNLFYTVYWAPHRHFELDDYMALFRYVEKTKKQYDLIFVCTPLLHVNCDDGFRTQDLAYRRVQTFMIPQFIPQNVQTVFVKTFSKRFEEDVRLRSEFCLRHLVIEGRVSRRIACCERNTA